MPPPLPITTLLEDLASQGATFTSGDLSIRKDLLSSARALCRALETPIEAVLRMEWAEPTLQACLRVAVEVKLFENLAEGGGGVKSSVELAARMGVEEGLLGRLLKHIAAMGVIAEDGPDKYTHTPLSNAWTNPVYRDAIPCCFDVFGPALSALPQYLAQIGYKSPTDSAAGAFQLGHHGPDKLFDWLQKRPEVGRQFNNHMAGYSIGRAQWYDPRCVPVARILGEGAKTDREAVMLVDIGGGTGRDIAGFQRAFPDLPGRLVLEDLPAVVEVAKLPASIEVVAHDFFTPQPVQGARAYYLHSVLHNWPDEKCQEILKNIIPAMTKGYSKILINEDIVPATNAYWMSTAVDIILMAVLCASKRTEASWKKLLTSVGLKVVNIYNYELGTESLIEAELE